MREENGANLHDLVAERPSADRTDILRTVGKWIVALVVLYLLTSGLAHGQTTLLNVSHDRWRNVQKTHFVDGGTFDQVYRGGGAGK